MEPGPPLFEDIDSYTLDLEIVGGTVICAGTHRGGFAVELSVLRAVGVEVALELVEVTGDREPSPGVQSLLRGIEGRLAAAVGNLGWRLLTGLLRAEE